MKERPILFSAPMVRAILNGSKTQTRRVLKKQPYVSRSNPPHFSDIEVGDLFVCPDTLPTGSERGRVIAECTAPGTYHCMGQTAFAEKHSPYGVAGDRLWVRETTYDVERNGYVGPVFVESEEGRDAAAWGYGESDDPDFIEPHDLRKRPAIHMPRSMCRLLLEITGARVERLNDISDADCIAEGIGLNPCAAGVMFTARDDDALPRAMYRDLWEKLYGVESWNANPWVWVVEFKRVDGAKGK